MKNAKGYAVRNADGEILVHTVSPNERGAKVNYLWVDCKATILNSMSDKRIAGIFDAYSKENNSTLVEVEISAT